MERLKEIESRKMGQKKSKMQGKTQGKSKKEQENGLPEIPRNSPLGWMLEHWEDCLKRCMRSKEQMIHYCIEVWGGKEIKRHLTWLMFGTFERCTCRALHDYVYDEYLPESEEMSYAKLWEYASTV